VTEVDRSNGVERLDNRGSRRPALHLFGRRRREPTTSPFRSSASGLVQSITIFPARFPALRIAV
jgi:hypothetical protein